MESGRFLWFCPDAGIMHIYLFYIQLCVHNKLTFATFHLNLQSIQRSDAEQRCHKIFKIMKIYFKKHIETTVFFQFPRT